MGALRLVFMGTPDFAVPALTALAEAGHLIICVYTQPPRPAGRGQRERKTPVQLTAEAMDVPVRCPVSLRDGDAQDQFRALGADAAVVAAYGLILPEPVLQAPRFGCVNIHASLLPRWRGAAPIQRAILAGDRETGITIMQMDKGLDTGDILLAGAVPIGPRTTAGSLHDTLAALGGRLIVEALDGLQSGKLTPQPQPGAGVTYAAKLSRDDGRLDWRNPAPALERQVRGLFPSPGAWFVHDGQRIMVQGAEIAGAAETGAPGTVLDDRLTVACGKGALRLLRVQRPGKNAMDARAFLRGYDLAAGTALELPEAHP